MGKNIERNNELVGHTYNYVYKKNEENLSYEDIQAAQVGVSMGILIDISQSLASIADSLEAMNGKGCPDRHTDR